MSIQSENRVNIKGDLASISITTFFARRGLYNGKLACQEYSIISAQAADAGDKIRSGDRKWREAFTFPAHTI